MRYPILSEAATKEVFESLAAGDDVAVDTRATWSGAGDDVDLSRLRDVTAAYAAELAGAGDPSDWEPLEGRLSAAIHAALADVPVPILDDHRFWSYVAFRHFWWYIARREATPIANGNGLKYVENRTMDAIPIRLFLRAQAALLDGDYSPAYALERSTDFWRSHVIRVRTGSTPRLTRAFVALQTEKKMPTDKVLRPFARRLNRAWSNVVLQLYDEERAADLVGDIYEATQLPPPTAQRVQPTEEAT